MADRKNQINLPSFSHLLRPNTCRSESRLEIRSTHQSKKGHSALGCFGYFGTPWIISCLGFASVKSRPWIKYLIKHCPRSRWENHQTFDQTHGLHHVPYVHFSGASAVSCAPHCDSKNRKNKKKRDCALHSYLAPVIGLAKYLQKASISRYGHSYMHYCMNESTRLMSAVSTAHIHVGRAGGIRPIRRSTAGRNRWKQQHLDFSKFAVQIVRERMPKPRCKLTWRCESSQTIPPSWRWALGRL